MNGFSLNLFQVGIAFKNGLGLTFTMATFTGEDLLNNPSYQQRVLEIERSARSRASYTLSSIEVAVSDWEASGKDPKLREKVERLISYKGALEEWERESLTSPQDDVASRVLRLKHFIALCRRFGDS